MTTLLNAGYPLSDELRLAIGELVCAAARAARSSREPNQRRWNQQTGRWEETK